MSKKYFWAMAVIAAFVAGTIATATPVFAPPPEDDGEGGWKAAIAEQQAQIDELKTNEILGFYTSSTRLESPEIEIVAFQAFCDSGDIATGGGVRGPFSDSMLIHRTAWTAFSDQQGWLAFISNLDSSDSDVIVVCADFDPEHIDED